MMQISQNDYISVLITYLKPLWKRSLLLFALLLTGIGLRLINPQLLATFIDTAIAVSTVSRLLRREPAFRERPARHSLYQDYAQSQLIYHSSIPPARAVASAAMGTIASHSIDRLAAWCGVLSIGASMVGLLEDFLI